jgi:molybdopterin-guanine dinucleotide biosynthesis protein A
MGRAKALLPWFGTTLIEHVVGRLRNCVDEVVVVTSASLDLPPLPARVVRDRRAERGPLAGIRDGLAALESDSEFAFVTSTDAPFLTERFVTRLLDREKPCAPIAEGHVQVLSAIYPRSAWALAEQLLEEGVGRPLRLLEALDYEQVKIEIEETEPPWRGFNTPEAYLACVRASDPEATAEIELVEIGMDGLEESGGSQRVPVGLLGDVLAYCAPTVNWLEGDRLATSVLVSLGDGELAAGLDVPVGPGDFVRVVNTRVAEV